MEESILKLISQNRTQEAVGPSAKMLEAVGHADNTLEAVGQSFGILQKVIFLIVACTILFTITFKFNAITFKFNVLVLEEKGIPHVELEKTLDEKGIPHVELEKTLEEKGIPYVELEKTLKEKGIPHVELEKTLPCCCVFFLHMHKAGGTTITYLFRKLKWYPRNGNGNPWRGKGVVNFWEYGKQQFNDFLLKLYATKVQFIAFEWNYFKNVEEIDKSRIRLVTCIRDPYSRFVSNMFAHGANASELLNPLTWMNRDFHLKKGNLWVNFNMPNYYVKMLNGYGDEPHREVSREDLETAKLHLNDFDVVVILEVAESFRLLKKYGIEYDGEIKNVNHKKRVIGMTQEQFRALNELDYEIYEYAKKISLKMLNDLTSRISR